MSAPDERNADRAAMIALAGISLACSTLITSGIVCSNDGSQYALIQALASGQAIIDPWVSYTREMDYAQMGDHFYSDRPPGTAFLALPFFVVARALGAAGGALEVAAGLVAMLAGAAAVVLLFVLARRLGVSRIGASGAGLVLALCTPHRSYSATLFSHALSSALVLGMIVLILPRDGMSPRARRISRIVGGVLGGYACGVDYTNGLPVMVACVAAAWLEARGDWRRAVRFALEYLAGGVLGVLPTLVYHTVVFGRPWSIPYHYDVRFTYAHSASSMYSGSFVDGFVGLLVSPRAGLFVWSPVLIAALAANVAMVRRMGARSAIVVLPWVALYLATSRNLTWDAGATQDVRYLVSVLPLIVLPIAWALDWAFGVDGRVRPVWLGVLGLLFFASMLIQFVKHNALWARDGSRWLPAIASTLETDPGPTLAAFARWAYPHPVAAVAVLAGALALAALVRAGGGTRARASEHAASS